MREELTDLLKGLHSNGVASPENDGAFEIALIHEVKIGRERDLVARINSKPVREALKGSPHLHALRFVSLDDGRRVLFHGRFDGPGAHGFVQFIASMRDTLYGIWQLCQGFPADCDLSSSAILDFLLAARQPIQARVSAYPSSDISEIRRAIDWMGKTEHFQIALARPPRPRD